MASCGVNQSVIKFSFLLVLCWAAYSDPCFAQDKSIEDGHITVTSSEKGEVTVQMTLRLDEGKKGDKAQFAAAKKKFAEALKAFNETSPEITDPSTGKKCRMKFEIVWADKKGKNVRPVRIHSSRKSLPEHWPEGFPEHLKEELRKKGNVPRKNTQQDLWIEEKPTTFTHELGHGFGLDDEKGGIMDHGAPEGPLLKRHYLAMSWPFLAKDQKEYQKRKTLLARIQVKAGKAGDLEAGARELLKELKGDDKKMVESYLKFLSGNGYDATEKPKKKEEKKPKPVSQNCCSQCGGGLTGGVCRASCDNSC